MCIVTYIYSKKKYAPIPLKTLTMFESAGQALWCLGLLRHLSRRCPKPDIFGRCQARIRGPSPRSPARPGYGGR